METDHGKLEALVAADPVVLVFTPGRYLSQAEKANVRRDLAQLLTQIYLDTGKVYSVLALDSPDDRLEALEIPDDAKSAIPKILERTEGPGSS